MSNGVAWSFVHISWRAKDTLQLHFDQTDWRLKEATAKLEVWKEWKPCSVTYYKWRATPYFTFPSGHTLGHFTEHHGREGTPTAPWDCHAMVCFLLPAGWGWRMPGDIHPAHKLIPSFGRWSPQLTVCFGEDALRLWEQDWVWAPKERVIPYPAMTSLDTEEYSCTPQYNCTYHLHFSLLTWPVLYLFLKRYIVTDLPQLKTGTVT